MHLRNNISNNSSIDFDLHFKHKIQNYRKLFPDGIIILECQLYWS